MRKRASVLLDDAERVGSVMEALRQAGLEGEPLASLRELGRRLDTEPPDLLVLEGPFAEHPGTELLGQLRAAGVGLPALLCCGSETERTAAGQRPALRPYLATARLDPAALAQALGRLLPAPPSSGPTLDERGRLSGQRLFGLLLVLLQHAWTGRLVLQSAGTEKTVFLDRGLPIYCSSNILSENFGQMLLRKGVISEIEYEWARKLQLREGIRQGEALVKIGVLNHRDLFGHLRDQIEQKIVNAFGWNDGTYALVAEEGFLDQVTRFALNPVSIAIAGLRRFMAPAELLGVWARLRHRFAVGACDVPEVASSVRQALSPAVLSALHEPQLVADLALAQGWDRLQAAAVFATLESAGFVQLADAPDALPPARGMDLEVSEERDRTGVYRALVETHDHVVIDGEQSEDQRRLGESLWKAYLRLSCADYFSVLGVSREAGSSEVVAARDELLDVYSDHRFRSVLDRLQNVRALEELQHKVLLAAETLLDEQRRRAYVSSLPDAAEPPRRNRVLTAEDEFQAGMSALSAEQGAEALDHFGRALALHPGEPLYMLYDGWSRYLAARGDGERAEGRRQMARAVAANPMLDEGYLLLARAYQFEGNLAEASDQARTALLFNPDNHEARELLHGLEA
jgi:tetratricopeptide (TPR) repeat protein